MTQTPGQDIEDGRRWIHALPVFANLFRPFLFARFSASFVAAVLVTYAIYVGYRVLSAYRASATSEGQLAIERRVELLATLVEVALSAVIAGLAIAVLGADRMTASIRGAMCAWGVLDASEWGFASLGVSVFAALGCALWIVVHRLDLRLRKPTLTRLKLGALFVVAPLVIADWALSTVYALDLDLRVSATCCSSGLEGASQIANGAAGGPRDWMAGLFVAGSVATITAGLLAWRAPSSRSALLLTATTLVASAASMPAIVLWVAPHAFETPIHLCPFCLLHSEVLGLGWPLFASLFVGTAMGLGAGLSGALEQRSGEPAEARAMQSELARNAVLAWIATLGLAIAPVVRWWIVSDGAPLFS